jgi:hypothetical protein
MSALRDSSVFELLFVHSQSSVADRPRISLLPNPNVVFVVDDDPGMLMSVKRLLRTKWVRHRAIFLSEGI